MSKKSGNEIHKKPDNIDSEQAAAAIAGISASSDLHRGCDTDSAALERLSQLLTSSKDSEVSVKNDLITLDDQFTQPRIVTAIDAEAPILIQKYNQP